jgi:hypothetical protein
VKRFRLIHFRYVFMTCSLAELVRIPINPVSIHMDPREGWRLGWPQLPGIRWPRRRLRSVAERSKPRTSVRSRLKVLHDQEGVQPGNLSALAGSSRGRLLHRFLPPIV